jgi:ATP synthase subunit 6
MSYSPLEQFSVLPMFTLVEGGNGSAWITFDNAGLWMLFTLFAALGFMSFGTYGSMLVPQRWQYVVESFYTFLQGVVNDTIGKKHGQGYFPFLVALFFYILFANFLGLVPYTFSVTAQIIVTFALGATGFFAVNVVAFREHGLHFFSFFVPKGAPKAMLPFLVLIEVVSYAFRVISLSVRLFANLTAGHCLLVILSGFCWTMLHMGVLMAIVSLLPFATVLAVTALEAAIAFLQAYVFTVLMSLFLSDAINMHLLFRFYFESLIL